MNKTYFARLSKMNMRIVVLLAVIWTTSAVNGYAQTSNLSKVAFLSPAPGGGGTGEFIQNNRQTATDTFGISLFTGNKQRMTLLNNGNVGIGTSNPSKGILHIKGSFHVESDSFQVFHISSQRALVFVGKTAYSNYQQDSSNANGIINQNKYSLWVSDGIVSEDFAIASTSQWSDYVFDKNYTLTPLERLEEYVRENKHLPAIPSEADVKKNGYSLIRLNQGFLKTMEELTLYSIDQEKKIKQLAEQAQEQQRQYQQLAEEVQQLKAQVAGSGKQ